MAFDNVLDAWTIITMVNDRATSHGLEALDFGASIGCYSKSFDCCLCPSTSLHTRRYGLSKDKLWRCSIERIRFRCSFLHPHYYFVSSNTTRFVNLTGDNNIVAPHLKRNQTVRSNVSGVRRHYRFTKLACTQIALLSARLASRFLEYSPDFVDFAVCAYLLEPFWGVRCVVLKNSSR
jgi:hypothetical protein